MTSVAFSYLFPPSVNEVIFLAVIKLADCKDGRVNVINFSVFANNCLLSALLIFIAVIYFRAGSAIDSKAAQVPNIPVKSNRSGVPVVPMLASAGRLRVARDAQLDTTYPPVMLARAGRANVARAPQLYPTFPPVMLARAGKDTIRIVLLSCATDPAVTTAIPLADIYATVPPNCPKLSV